MIDEKTYIEKLNLPTQERQAPKVQFIDLLNRDISLVKTRFKDKHKETLYGELSILLNAGVDIIESLSIISQQFSNSTRQSILKTIRTDLINGSSFSLALRKSEQFTNYESFSIQIGEETGRLIEICSELHEFFKRKIIQKRKIVSALSYPFVVTCTAIVAVAFMLRFMVPMFSNVYKQFGGELPKISQLVLAISDFLQQYGLFIFSFLLTGGFLIATFKNNKWLKRVSDRFLFRMPVFGTIFKKIYLARFSRSMSLLLGSGVPLLSAIEFTQKMIGRITIQEYLTGVAQNIMNGRSLHESLVSFHLFDSKFISMVKVGETSNQLPYLFNQLSEQYANEVEHQTSLINSILEPALILFLGVVVGFILVALYLPIFKLSTNFGI